MRLFEKRKPKEFYKMIEDPTFPYRIGRITGAAEIASQLLLHQEKPDVQIIGTALGNTVAWFFDDEGIKDERG